MEHQMRMFFHYGYENQFLLEHFAVDNPLKLWFTCAVLFAISIIFEAIKYARCVRCGCINNKPLECPNGDGNRIGIRLAQNCYIGRLRDRKHRLIQTLLHTIQTALGFLLMLSVMSFNVCLIFAVLMGSAAGYFIFYRSYNEIEAIDSCH